MLCMLLVVVSIGAVAPLSFTDTVAQLGQKACLTPIMSKRDTDEQLEMIWKQLGVNGNTRLCEYKNKTAKSYKNVPGNCTATTYCFAPFEDSHAGKYQLQIVLKNSSIYFYEAYLIALVVVTDANVTITSDAVVTCDTDGTYEKYRWFVNNDEVKNKTDNRLSLTYAQATQCGNVTCIVTNIGGTANATLLISNVLPICNNVPVSENEECVTVYILLLLLLMAIGTLVWSHRKRMLSKVRHVKWLMIYQCLASEGDDIY